MKKFIKKMLTAALSVALSVTALTGCAVPERPGGGGDIEEIDATRTQLFVFNFDGGYGTDWLVKAKEQFEEMHKDDEWETGKKGVQVYINSQKVWGATNTILDNRDEVYFTEAINYRDLLADDIFADITEAVTGDKAELTGFGEFDDEAGSTIESKLTEQQKEWFGIQRDDGVHYYAVPHYSGYYTLFYNADAFDKYNYYLAKNPTGTELIDYFVHPVYSPEKSLGPDGKTGVIDGVNYSLDDGLPATYEEFFMLCDLIASQKRTPLVWSGADHAGYLNAFAQSLYIDFEGLSRGSQDYSLGGIADDLGTVDAGGNFVREGDYEIQPDTAYKLAQREGRYRVLQFMEKMITTKTTSTSKTAKYPYSLSFNGGFSHMNAQESFLYADHDDGETATIGMLIDGVWWEAEATATFNEMVSGVDANLSKSGRKFAIMPFPKADSARVGQKNTLFDHINSAVFVKRTIEDWKKPLALEFIKFINTDAQLVQYSQITDTPKALEYEMTGEALEKMSPYGRSLMSLKSRSDIVYPYSLNPVYLNNVGHFGTNPFWTTQIANGTSRSSISTTFRDTSVRADEYFNGLVTYRQKHWNELTI